MTESDEPDLTLIEAGIRKGATDLALTRWETVVAELRKIDETLDRLEKVLREIAFGLGIRM